MFECDVEKYDEWYDDYVVEEIEIENENKWECECDNEVLIKKNKKHWPNLHETASSSFNVLNGAQVDWWYVCKD